MDGGIDGWTYLGLTDSYAHLPRADFSCGEDFADDDNSSSNSSNNSAMKSFSKIRTLDSSSADTSETPTASSPKQPKGAASTPPKGPNSSPKVKPMVIIIDEPFENDSESPPRSPSTRSGNRAAAADMTGAASPIGSATASPSGSPKARGSDSQSQMRGFSKVSFRIKQLVSKEKRRFEEDGFNLDLTYVTSRLIAFGYPAENLEGIYRNHYKDVYNFFEQRHPQRYRIYNLCTERSYDKEKFHNRVAEFRFDDHCPPPVAMFLPFCQDVDAWLQEHPENVAAIHCKAGKGRTGVMICAYLLYTGAWKTADAAMHFFAAARSLKSEGVTIPSQRRFIAYFGELCRRARSFEQEAGLGDAAAASRDHSEWEDEAIDSGDVEREREFSGIDFMRLWQEAIEGRGVTTKRQMFQCQPKLPVTTHLKLIRIKISGVYTQRKIDPRVRIECGGTSDRLPVVYELSGTFTYGVAPPAIADTSVAPDAANHEADRSSLDDLELQMPAATPPSSPNGLSARAAAVGVACVDLELACDRCVLWDEVKVVLRNRNGTKIGHFWFHTAFVRRAATSGGSTLVLAKHEIDKVVKDVKRKHKLFAPSFSVTLAFERATAEEVAAAAFAQKLAGLRADAVVSPGGGRQLRVWPGGREKRSDGALYQFSSAKTSPSAGGGGAERPRAKSDRGAQQLAASGGDVQVFAAGRVDGAAEGGGTRPAERSSPATSPVTSPVTSPKSQLSRFFTAAAARKTATAADKRA